MSLVTHRVGRRLLGAIASIALAAGGASAIVPASASPATPSTLADKLKPLNMPQAGRYVVVMKDQPEAIYNGNIAGYPATRPAPGQKFQNDVDAARYRGYLESRQNKVLAAAGVTSKIYSYTTAVSGFTAQLTAAQVVRLRKDSNVLSVELDKANKLDTVDSPEFLGLSGRNGEWAQHGGPAKAGKNMVVGVLDTGLWMPNPSFAGSPRVPDVPGFQGYCERGERWRKITCNSKVISARYFVDGIGEQNVSRHDYISPRDGDGHGSHTASTAAGNHGVKVTIDGQNFGRASGMAPAAKIAVYKVCWTAKIPENTGCYDSDTVAAINKAVQDGVDVINYSISGSQDDFQEAVEMAFLGAASAGVFVATSAGNSGPSPSTVAHPGPWVATVAASTHHLFPGKVVLGNGKSYSGAMISDQRVSMRRIILAVDAAKGKVPPRRARKCFRGSLDRDKVENRIVVCDRGTNARVTKSLTVKNAGGAGMVLVNVSPNSLDADVHAVPTVHIDDVKGAKLKEYVQARGKKARAALDPNAKPYEPVPTIAGFSSRGPILAGEGDILKPDLSAPGVSVVAAVAPPFHGGNRWDLISGTSMASPHVAGLGAFIKRLRPDWSPAIVKSAMMTTAYNLKAGHSPFNQGAGHVNPRRFLDPGLAYNAGPAAWFNFLEGERQASDLNQASIAIGDLAGRETVRRVVTNVTNHKETYRAEVTGVEGIDVNVRPRVITVAPGRTTKFKVNFTANGAAKFKKYATGHLTWVSKDHRVRSPLAIRPVAVAVPEEVFVAQGTTDTTSGEKVIRGQAGFTGNLNLEVVGLEGATPEPGSVAQGEQVTVDTMTFKRSTAVARFDLDAEDDNDDLDLFLEIGGNIVAASATGEADEQITINNPPAGVTVDVVVDGYDDASGNGEIPFTYTGWRVPRGDQGNLTVDPDPVPVKVGEQFRYTASWDNLALNQRWFGFVRYVGRGERTYVTIN